MDSADRIQVYKENPHFWQYKGKPTLLLGGSVEDNLYQIPDLEAHLDLLASVGGNYVRCTMSCRDEGDVWPFEQVEGQYDLDRWSDEFWRRFQTFLEIAAARDIVAQIEVWATFDYSSTWDRNPYNPKNNRNYTAEESGLPERVASSPPQLQNPWFWTTYPDADLPLVLDRQRRFVDKLLSHALPFGNVLYCMDNETHAPWEWGAYWSGYIKDHAKQAGFHVETTQMYWQTDIRHPAHNAAYRHPEVYSFCEVSQNSGVSGQAHWDHLQAVREKLQPARPLNNVKIYGADTGPKWAQGDQNGTERFWRGIFGGQATARFHRPPAGLGLGETAQAHIQSCRTITDELGIFTCEPHNDLLTDRQENAAYAVADPGRAYAVYFPTGLPVTMDLAAAPGELKLRWLEIAASTWAREETVRGGGTVTLQPPSQAQWAALIAR